MFSKKKDVSGAKEHRLGGKDVKKLVERLSKEFAKDTEQVKSALGISKGQDAVFVRKLPNKVTGYVVDGCIRFFQVEEEWYPTVESLWSVPDLLPRLVVHAPVSRFVLNGSDVMLPGLANKTWAGLAELGPIVKGQKRCLVANGNPLPFAIGEMMVDTETIKLSGFRGKGMQVVHHYGDLLWESSGSRRPNEFFLKDEISPLPDFLESEGECEEECSPDQTTREDSNSDALFTASENAITSVQESSINSTAVINADSGQSVLKIEAGDRAESLDKHGQTDGIGFDTSAWTEDELLERTFLQCIKKKIRDRDLPMLSNQFFSNFMLGCRPVGSTIDIKKSSFKKVGKFLIAMEEKGLIIMSREKGGTEKITAIERRHPEIAQFKPWPAESMEENALENENNDAGDKSTVRLLEFLRPQSKACQSVILIGKKKHPKISGTGPKGEYYTAPEIKMLFLAYCDEEGLENQINRSAINIGNDVILGALFGSEKKRTGVTVPKTMEKSAAVRQFQENLLSGHQFIYPDGTVSKFKAIAAPRIEIMAEVRQGRKYVTRAWNFELYGLQPEMVAKDAQIKFSCACTTQPRPGKEGDSIREVVIQGKVLRELEDYLCEQYGLNKSKHINVEDGKGKKGGR